MKSRIFSICLGLALCYLVLEAGTCMLLKANVLQGDVPSFSARQIGARFWRELDPNFGVWHEPNVSFLHRKSCFEVEYRSNSLGMRDVERQKLSVPSRTVVLGDSFVEGWGVELGSRLSDLLERSTGREFLNFGTSGHFSPTQYYLLYKTLAKEFSHDAVLVGILPSNDFDEDDYLKWKHQGRYRPFWEGEAPNARIVYSDAPLGEVGAKRYLAGFFREFSYLYNAVKFVIMSRSLQAHDQAGRDKELVSKFYDFSETEYQRLLLSLEKIREEASGKKLSVFLIPILNDLQRYDRAGKSPLASRLESWGAEHEVQVLDLLPWMHDSNPDWKKYYFPCDEHWSAYGHRTAFDYLKGKL
jgi:GDSL-like Lipase/Acylhydrolase.